MLSSFPLPHPVFGGKVRMIINHTKYVVWISLVELTIYFFYVISFIRISGVLPCFLMYSLVNNSAIVLICKINRFIYLFSLI